MLQAAELGSPRHIEACSPLSFIVHNPSIEAYFLLLDSIQNLYSIFSSFID